MTDQRYARGATARLFLNVVINAVPYTGELPTAAVRRVADSRWFQASDKSWQVAIVNNSMAELDAVNEPGRYFLDFDQSSDVITGSLSYRAKLVNTGAHAMLEYQDLAFGPLGSAVPPVMCAIQGTLFGMGGGPLVNAMVRATLVPTFTDRLGRGIEEALIETFSDATGSFSLAVVQGAVIRLEIDAIGYDRRVTVPASSSVVFTTL
jgi:hypothetical protein